MHRIIPGAGDQPIRRPATRGGESPPRSRRVGVLRSCAEGRPADRAGADRDAGEDEQCGRERPRGGHGTDEERTAGGQGAESDGEGLDAERVDQSDAATNPRRPPTMTGFAPILSLRAPKIGLRNTSATSYRASTAPSPRRERPMSSDSAPRTLATPWAPNAVVNPARYSGASAPRRRCRSVTRANVTCVTWLTIGDGSWLGELQPATFAASEPPGGWKET